MLLLGILLEFQSVVPRHVSYTFCIVVDCRKGQVVSLFPVVRGKLYVVSCCKRKVFS